MKFVLVNEQTERLLFRRVERTDSDKWLLFFKDPRSFQYRNTVLKEPEAECEAWYKKQFSRYLNDLGGMNALIEKQSGHLIGHCGLLVQDVDKKIELEIGYSLLPAYWNKGYASEAPLFIANEVTKIVIILKHKQGWCVL